MYSVFDASQKNITQTQLNQQDRGVGETTKYEGKENSPMPYFYRQKEKKQKEEPKKEKRNSNGSIDIVV